MKRTLLILIITIGSAALMAQGRVIPNRPNTILNSGPGYITINELQAGIGLGKINTDYSKSMYGFTTIHGYQVNKSFVLAGGSGAIFYNGGMLIPLFMDFRASFRISTLTPYAYGDGGILMNFSDLVEGSKIFINAGAGIRYAFSRKIAANLSAGYWIQNGVSRDSFVVVKAGVTYKPRR
jgi:hypothetical protein